MRIFLCAAVLVIQALITMATRGALKEEMKQCAKLWIHSSSQILHCPNI